MGMAASQARLLSITARIHDVEYQAQALQNAKVQLSTQSDQAYEDYNNALNDTTLTLCSIDSASGEKSTVAANFNNLVSSNKLKAADGKSYALMYNGSLIVEDDVYNAYKAYKDFKDTDDQYIQNGYHFAMYMLGGEDNFDLENIQYSEFEVYSKYVKEGGNKELTELFENILNLIGKNDDWDSYLNSGIADDNTKKIIYSTNDLNPSSDDSDAVLDEKKKKRETYNSLLYQFRNKLYTSYAYEIYTNAYDSNVNEEAFNSSYLDKFSNYIDIFNQIDANGGNCRPISDFDGPSGNAANNSEWLKNMVESGIISINTVTTDSKTGEVSFNGASPSSSSTISYTDTTSIDKRALAKAEAEYNKKLKDIDRKDKQYDLSLSKLETERSALTTEYDSVKKVIEDNIERTFGIFS